MCDVEIRNEGTIVVIDPVSEEAQAWCDEHVEVPDYMMMGTHAFAADHRMAGPIMDGMIDAGLKIGEA